MLPPLLLPSDPLDTINQRCLNYENASRISPLKSPLQIEMHNATHFLPQSPKYFSLIKYQPPVPLNKVSLQKHPLKLLKYLHKETYTTPTPPSISLKTATLHSTLTLSTDMNHLGENYFSSHATPKEPSINTGT